MCRRGKLSRLCVALCWTLKESSLQRDENLDGMWRLQTCRYDVMYWVCVHACSSALLCNSSFTYGHISCKLFMSVALGAHVWWGCCLWLFSACDIICQHVLPCSDRNPAATGNRAGPWVEGSGFVTSLPGHSWNIPSHCQLVGSST